MNESFKRNVVHLEQKLKLKTECQLQALREGWPIETISSVESYTHLILLNYRVDIMFNLEDSDRREDDPNVEYLEKYLEFKKRIELVTQVTAFALGVSVEDSLRVTEYTQAFSLMEGEAIEEVLAMGGDDACSRGCEDVQPEASS